MPLNPKAKRIKKKSIQDIQDDIFRKMSADKKFKFASDFSMFLLELNTLGNYDGFSKTTRTSRRNS